MKKIIWLLIIIIASIQVVHANPFVLTEKIEGEFIQINYGWKKQSLNFYGVKDTKTNDFIYCIEPGVKLSEQIYEEILDEFDKVGLTKEQYEEIAKIAYFGYGYDNRVDLKWYLATQMLIWEKLIDASRSIYFTNYLGGQKIKKYQSEKNQILNDVFNNFVLPEFESNEYVVSINDELILYDQNEVMDKYQVKGDLPFTIKDHKMVIQANKEGSYDFSFTKNFVGNQKPIAYYHEQGQNLFRSGELESVNKNIKVKVLAGAIIINKIDEETKMPLSDTTFLIKNQDDQIVFEGKTDEFGSIELTDLAFGTYFIYEKLSKDGYYNDHYYQEITIDENHLSHQIKVENRKITMIPDTLKNEK